MSGGSGLGSGSWDDDDDKKGDGKPKMRFEFDCPTCNANNPWGDGFKDGDEVNCHYCGATLEARFTDEGKLKVREL
ncbi:MAG: hypothetical protein JNM17_07535 [Archangium sp.]|nr:hypothetical protein [Archangium sp.]